MKTGEADYAALRSNEQEPERMESVHPSEAMLTKRELAERLKMTVRTVENWQRRGFLPYMKVGRMVLFHWPDVLEHLKSRFGVCRPR